MAKTVNVTAQGTPTANTLALLDAGSGAQTGITEQDLIRQLIDSSEFLSSRLKGKLRTSVGGKDDAASEALDTASRTGQTQVETSLKLCQRMWSAYTKYIRSQCNKDRLVDTLLYGFFFKKDGDDLTTGPQYCYANDAKRGNAFADFKLIPGSENYSGLTTGMTEGKEGVQANVNGIARVCNCPVDQVLSFLQKVRESAIQATMQRKKQVCLNVGVGTLTLYPNQTFEFRSAGPHTAHGDSISVAPSSIGDIRSQYIDNDRKTVNVLASNG